jgi:SAM-dependent methyltransferase
VIDYTPRDAALYSNRMRPSLQKAFRDAANLMQDVSEHHSDKFPYIPLSLDQFEPMMQPLVKPGMRVIDVGCGAGDKLYAWWMLEPTLRITGIELDELMARFARFTCPFAEVVCGNAFKHDFQNYDLVYMYRPIPSEDGQATLQDYVMQSMRIGARLVVVYQAYWFQGNYQFFPRLGATPNDSGHSGWVKEKSYAKHVAEWNKTDSTEAKHSRVA